MALQRHTWARHTERILDRLETLLSRVSGGEVRIYRIASGGGRTPDQLAEALTAEPCNAPSPDEVQGEAITFLSDKAYSTVSEGSNPDLFVVPNES